MLRVVLLALIASLTTAGSALAQGLDEQRRSESPLLSGPPAQAEPAAHQLTKAPELLESAEADYPKEAEAAKLTGSVGLLVDIDATGAVTAVEVAEPAGHGFDEAAAAALREFRFSPAEVDGAPAPVRIAYRYHFVLRPEAPPPAQENVVNLRGQLLQRGNRAPVPNATVALDEGELGATSDAQGRFEIAGVPPGRHRVVANAPGFDRYEIEESIEEGRRTELTLYLRKRVFGGYETVVRGQREKKEVARVELEQEELKLVPGTQGDAFKVVQDLPGVNRAPYGLGLLIVRGGRPQDTRVYIDGVWVPIVFHFGALTSAFNSDLLSDLTFQPGNFGAQYGRAIAGTVDAQSRTPSREAYHGYLNVSLIDTSALIEGPLADGWSFAAAGRVSYADWILAQVLPAYSVELISAPRYWDYQLKVEHAPVDGDERISILAFGSNDSMKARLDNPALLDPEGRSEVGGSLTFHRLVGSWSRKLSTSINNKATAALCYDAADTSVGSDIGGSADSWILQAREGLAWEARPTLTLDAGLDLFVGRYHSDITSMQMPSATETPDMLLSKQLVHEIDDGPILQPGVYVEATWKPFPGTRAVPGLRLDYIYGLGFFTLDPRLAVFQQVGELTTLKGAVGLYQQPPDYKASQWSPVFGNPDLGPERSLQTMLGVERKLTEAIGLDLQLYYKRLTQLSYPSDRVVERDGEQVLERWGNVGNGHTYGAEILLRHELTHHFFGWISYSYSRSLRRSGLWSDPALRPSAYDQPHHLVAVASYKWPYDWITGVRFQYSSGNRRTPIVGRVYDADADMWVPVPGSYYSEVGPYFLSLDLRVDKRLVFDQWSLSVYLDVQNVTNNVNAEYVLYNYDYTQARPLRGLPIFPTLGLKAEF